jgi:hypothetical protein
LLLRAADVLRRDPDVRREVEATSRRLEALRRDLVLAIFISPFWSDVTTAPDDTGTAVAISGLS